MTMGVASPNSDGPVARLVEHLQDWHSGEVRCDKAARLVQNVALTGMQSRNGYVYTAEALQGAVPLYADKPVFLDHPRSGLRPQERSARDLVGTISNPRFENGRVRGDIAVVNTEAGQTFLGLAETPSPAVGMSHVVLAQRSADGTRVEKIVEVVSVDAVAFPATNATLTEQQSPPAAAAATESDDLERQVAELREQVHGLLADRRELLVSLQELRQERVRREQELRVNQLLEQSRLPPPAISPAFRRQLAETADETERAVLIEDRRALWSLVGRSNPSSRERRDAGTPQLDEARMIQILKRQPLTMLAHTG